MDAKHCWILSLTIHGALILGAGVMAFEHYVSGDGEGSVFSLNLGKPTPRFDRIERPKDLFAGRTPVAESSATAINEIFAYPGTSWMDQEHEEGCNCCCEYKPRAPAATSVGWPGEMVSYFHRKLSMATSRRGAPKIYAHSRRCASRDSGLEVDCNCGLIPPRY